MEDNINTAAVETGAQTVEDATATQEVVASAEESVPGGEQQATEEAKATTESVPKAHQSKEVNAQYKANRQKAEAISNGVLDLARSKGLNPRDAEEAIQMLMADAKATDQMQKDLEAIRQVDPTVESLESLGDEFEEAVRGGMDGLSAYYMIKGKQAAMAAAKPPNTGDVGTKTDTDRDYTSEELDRLTSKDLDDPNVFQRAMRSLRNLK